MIGNLKAIVVFLFFFSVQGSLLAQSNDQLDTADSLFFIQKYTEAFDIYTSIFSSGNVTESNSEVFIKVLDSGDVPILINGSLTLDANVDADIWSVADVDLSGVSYGIYTVVAIGTDRVKENVIGTPGFENVEALATNENIHRPEGERFYAMDAFDLGVDNLDMVLTFRNLHNFGEEARHTMNVQVFGALKSGGRYGVVDHTRRHMEALDNENGRRIDPVLVIKEMLDVGFEFVGYSDLHFRADDELEYEVGRRSVSGNTDRFTMLFQKP